MLAHANTGMGGAERRMIKVLDALSDIFEETGFSIVVNQSLMNGYRRDPEMALVLEKKNVHICVLPNPNKRELRILAKLRGLRRRTGNIRVIRNLHVKYGESISWASWLKEHVGPNDVVHCYAGVSNILGAVCFASHSNVPVLIEGTSPRVITWISNFIADVSCRRNLKNLYLQCVSETVCENIPDAVRGDLTDVKVGVFSGPFMVSRGRPLNMLKKQVIMFPHRFIAAKNGVLFARVIRHMYRYGLLEGWKVKFRGRGPEEDKIRQILNEELSRGAVEVGFTSDLASELAESRICVGLIKTDNYPSQSLFEAMKHGNILLLSRTGSTQNKFGDKYIEYVDLEEDSVTNGLMNTIHLAQSCECDEVSAEIRHVYNELFSGQSYIDDVMNIYCE